jgi:hypothetical protein
MEEITALKMLTPLFEKDIFFQEANLTVFFEKKIHSFL